MLAQLPTELQAPPPSWLANLPWALLVTIVGEALALVFLLRVVRRGGSTAVTMNWAFVVLLAPYFGLLLYYLLPHRIYRRRLRRRAERLAWIDPTLTSAVADTSPIEPADSLNRLLWTFDPDSVQIGNELELLSTGHAVLTEIRAAIERAERFVHLQTYIFRPDAAGLEVLALLTEAARRGVEVRLLYDSFGSWSLKNRHLAGLRAAGGKAAPFMPLLWRRRPFTLNLRNHRKLLVVDGKQAILGGRNIGVEYLTDRIEGSAMPWLDAMVEVIGPAVARLHRVFVEDWYHAAEEDLADVVYFPRQSAAGPDCVGVIDTGPDVAAPQLPLVLLQLIGSARRRLDISTPYLVPSPVVLTALELAALRGVHVRIHTNGPPVEQWLLYRAQRSYYRRLLRAGVQLYESRRAYNHSKIILVDQRYACIGSPNLDWRSAELNFEIAIAATRGQFVRDVASLFEHRLGSAERVEQQPPERLFDSVCRLASPLL
jgi:cardiolipin synthase